MSRKPDYFRTRFVIRVKDNAIHGTKQATITALLIRNYFYGIGISSKIVGIDTLEVTTRTQIRDIADKDRSFIRDILSHFYGDILDEAFEGRYIRDGKEIWEVFV